MFSLRIPSRTLLANLAFLFLAFTLASGSGLAQKPESKPGKGPAYTTPPKKDLNYSLMGEFVGQIRLPREKKKRVRLALQIRPIAGNQFHAMAYYGGLPGEPGHQSDELRLIGLRSKDSVVLSGGPWAIFVDSKGCSIIASSGKLLGRLKRIHRVSPTLGAQPPEGATVLFDGTNVDNFVKAQMTESGLLKQGGLIAPMFQDFNLHAEFRLPYMPQAEGQQRGNSGFYLQSRYECQVLDSFGTERMFNGLGALYRTKAPDLNMAFPPLVWQTYDIQFTAPRWASDGTKVRDAHVTSWVNGVKVQDNVALQNKTGAGKPEAPTLLPINIQDHGDPVRFRNIWIVDRGLTATEFPVIATKKQRVAAASLEWNAKAEEPKKPTQESKEPAEDPVEPVEESKEPAEVTETNADAAIDSTPKVKKAEPKKAEPKKEPSNEVVKKPTEDPAKKEAKEELPKETTKDIKEEKKPAEKKDAEPVVVTQ